jgi:excisionase family DNA binding protein
MGQLLSTTQVAARLGVSVARVQTFIWEGRLAAIKVGRAYAIDEDDLKSVENRKTGRPPTKTTPGANKRATGLVRATNGTSTSGRGEKKGSKR